MTPLGISLVSIATVILLIGIGFQVRYQIRLLSEFRGTSYITNIVFIIIHCWVVTLITAISIFTIMGMTFIALYLTPPILLMMLIVTTTAQSIYRDYYLRRLNTIY